MKESDRYCLNEPKATIVELNNKSSEKMFESNETVISGISIVDNSAGEYSPKRVSVEFDLGDDTLKNSESTSAEILFSPDGVFEDSTDRDKEQVEVFPNLPDELLKEMDLLGNQSGIIQNDQELERRFQNDEELERKFINLRLAFSSDSKTVRDRCQQQKRHRDQTEENFAIEIFRLTERVNRLSRLCVDMETTEILDALLTQIEIVMNASKLACASAERYGAVQHEYRLSEAVQLMVNYVNALKQQRDMIRDQLKFTKKVIQENGFGDENASRNPKTPQSADINTRRRASFAVGTLGSNNDNTKRTVIRRTSESTFRTGAIPKLPRSNFMDSGADLVNIKEGGIEEVENPEPHTETVTKGCDESDNVKLQKRSGVSHYLNIFQEKAEQIYKEWSERGPFSHLFHTCAILCFCFAIIVMSDVLFELELSRR